MPRYAVSLFVISAGGGGYLLPTVSVGLFVAAGIGLGLLLLSSKFLVHDLEFSGEEEGS